MVSIHLSKTERNELIQLRKQASSKDSEKALMILLSGDGISPIEISKQLKRHPHTVRYWLKRYNESGISGLSRKYSPGRPSERKSSIIPFIEEWLQDSPQKFGYKTSEWTVSIIAEEYYRQVGKKVSEDTIQRALKDAGFSYKRPKKGVPLTAPSKEEKKTRALAIIEEIKNFVEKDEAEIFSLDEAHFSTEPYIIRGWFKKKRSSSNSHSDQKGTMYDIWSLEYGKTKILLEKSSQR